MGEDGRLIFKTALDNTQLEKDLAKAKRRIQDLSNQVFVKEQQKIPLEQQSKKMAAVLDEAKAKLAEMQSGKQYFPLEQITEQQERVKALQKEWNKVEDAVDGYKKSIAKSNSEIEAQKILAGAIEQELATTSVDTEKMASATEKAKKSANGFATQIKYAMSSILLYGTLFQIYAAFTEWTGKVILANDEASMAVSRLKGALLTLAQPILNVVIPAFTAFVNILADVINAIARVVSFIFGTTAQESADAAEGLYEEQNAIEGVGSAAEEAQKQLASFDEINKLAGDTSAGGGGAGGGALDEIAPSFEDFDSAAYKQKLDEITAYLSGALLALGAILAFSGANIPLGIALMAAGAVGLASVLAMNWNAMPDSVKLAVTRVLTILGAAAMVVGAILAFSGANVPLGIGLMIAGAAALGTAVAVNWNSMTAGIQNAVLAAMEIIGAAFLVIGAILCFTGANVPLGLGLMAIGAASLAASAYLNWKYIGKNIEAVVTEITLLMGASLLAVGAVLALSGVNVPLGIGLMAAGAASLAAAAVINWDYIVSQMQGETGKITAIVSAAFLALGAILVFTGVSFPLGVALMAAGAASLIGVASINWNYITGQLQGEIGVVTAIASSALLALGVILCFTGAAIPLGVALIAAGAAGLVTVGALNWNAILDKLKGVWNDIKSWWNTSVSKFLTLNYWKSIGSNIINGLSNGLKSAWSGIKSWVSEKAEWISDAFSSAKNTASSIISSAGKSTRASVYSVPNLSLPQIPKLASGGVIPPNREFLAVLGDQTSGTNVEAPLATIKQALIEALQSAGGMGGGTTTVVVNLDGKEVARNTVKHVNNMTRQAGKPVLLL